MVIATPLAPLIFAAWLAVTAGRTVWSLWRDATGNREDAWLGA
jgi:hypothetical protein